jgi:hypothetical protein
MMAEMIQICSILLTMRTLLTSMLNFLMRKLLPVKRVHESKDRMKPGREENPINWLNRFLIYL